MKKASVENSTGAAESILVGLTGDPDLQVPLFLAFLSIQLITLGGDGGITVAVYTDPHLHTPRTSSSAASPLWIGLRISVAVLPSGTESSLTTDVLLSPLFGGFAASECFLRASMAHDLHAVVCRPLHYTNTVTTGVCPPDSGLLTSVASSVPRSTRQTASDSPLVQMRSITFSATSHHSWLSGAPKHAISKLAVFFVVSFNVFFTLLVILTSSLFTCIAVAPTCSAEGRSPPPFVRPTSSHVHLLRDIHCHVITAQLHPLVDTDKAAFVLYGVVRPMLNPLIYSLRSKEVRNALWKILNKLNLQFFSVSRR